MLLKKAQCKQHTHAQDSRYFNPNGLKHPLVVIEIDFFHSRSCFRGENTPGEGSVPRTAPGNWTAIAHGRYVPEDPESRCVGPSRLHCMRWPQSDSLGDLNLHVLFMVLTDQSMTLSFFLFFNAYQTWRIYAVGVRSQARSVFDSLAA